MPEPIEMIATRNMFYNEQKKHVRTKKEILDDSGNVRKGCKIIKKSEVYERTLFTAKNKLFKQEHYLDEAKRFYIDLINLLIEDDKDKLHVFDKNGLYLATKKIGKNNPKAEQIKEDNEVRMQWNHEVDRALVSQVPEDEIRQIKQKWITERIRLSIDVFGKCPEKLSGIITTATAKLALLITITATVSEAEVVEQPRPQISPRPVMPPEAAAFPRLQKVKLLISKIILSLKQSVNDQNWRLN